MNKLVHLVQRLALKLDQKSKEFLDGQEAIPSKILENTLDCYVLPGEPLPALLPKECVAEIIENPVIVQLKNAPASWMKGHVTWDGQSICVLSYSALHDPELDESDNIESKLVVLNPIPDAPRKTFVGILCFGEVKEAAVGDNIVEFEAPERVDRRYIETSVAIGTHHYLIPKLAAIAIAFSYF